MASSTSPSGISLADSCAVCSSSGCDLKLIGCGCLFHVTCLPLSLILDDSVKSDVGLALGPRREQNICCPGCSTGTCKGIQVLPLSFDQLKRSVQLRVAEAKASGAQSEDGNNSGNKRDRSGSEDYLLEVEAAQAVFSQGNTSSSSDSDSNRTGRWTDEEVEYVDHLLKAFDKGRLPLCHGTKLATFLGSALLCKATRLTKKMKNAKLSTRSFVFQPATVQTSANSDEASVLKALQDRFVMSLQSEYSRLEAEYNLSMHWRTCFSDLCVQVGYPHLDGSSFIASLEEYEHLAANAEDGVRSVRRRRFASFSQPDHPAVAVTSNAAPSFLPTSSMEPLGLPAHNEHAVDQSDYDFTFNPEDQEDLHDQTFMVGMFEAEETGDKALPSGGMAMAAAGTRMKKASTNPFLEVIAKYLEELDLPFQHADTWVPSFVGNGSDDEVRLIHSGSVTRQDQDSQRWSAFENFGHYSESFTFSPSKGLVGRVYSSGQTQWEFGINKLDPDFFLRAGGAEEYGVRTALGIPFSTPGVGRMVVVLYSCSHIAEDTVLADQFAQELSSYSPEPKWKMVVEMTDHVTVPPSTEQEQDPSSFQRHVSFNDFPSPAGQDTYSSQDKDSSTIPSFNFDREGAGVVTPRETGDDDVEKSIVSLLGDLLAIQSEDNFDDPSLFQELMRMRLLLLRPASRRNNEDNHKIDVLKDSYKNYSAGNHRVGKDIATLLAKEWRCLSQCSNNEPTMGHQSTSRIGQSLWVNAGSSDQYKSHEFSPSMQPLRSADVPVFNLGQGMSAPPMKLEHHDYHNPDKVSLERSLERFRARGRHSILSFDHSIQTLLPSSSSMAKQNNFGPQSDLKEISSPMSRAVSCGSNLAGSSNTAFFSP